MEIAATSCPKGTMALWDSQPAGSYSRAKPTAKPLGRQVFNLMPMPVRKKVEGGRRKEGGGGRGRRRKREEETDKDRECVSQPGHYLGHSHRGPTRAEEEEERNVSAV